MSKNKQDLCECGTLKQSRSKRCRKCFLDDRESMSINGKEKGSFKKGYIPWNKGTKGLTTWSEIRREKKYAILIKNGGPMLGKKHSIESRLKISNSNKREKGVNWQGGKTSESHMDRHSSEARIWKESLLERDKNCRVCGSTMLLESHHINPWRICKNTPDQFCINNGILLCRKCHRQTTRKEICLVQFFTKLIHQKNRVNSGETLEEMKRLLRQS